MRPGYFGEVVQATGFEVASCQLPVASCQLPVNFFPRIDPAAAPGFCWVANSCDNATFLPNG